MQQSHGMTSCSEWTSVLRSTLFKECALKGSATWFVAEGAEEVKRASSMPSAKAMDDCLIAYGQNGEALRLQQGFPVGPTSQRRAAAARCRRSASPPRGGCSDRHSETTSS